MDIKNINNNILATRWRQKYDRQPDGIKAKLDRLDAMSAREYQLRVIKRSGKYPQTGDIFILKPTKEITLSGIVMNDHINNINGSDLLLVLIFKEDTDVRTAVEKSVFEELLLPPQIVGQEYWTRGYFYCTDHIEHPEKPDDYGFYSIGKGMFLDEYGTELASQPKLLGTYGVSSITGIARKVNQELIIAGRV